MTPEQHTEPAPFVELIDVVDKLSVTLTDADAYYTHQQNGTLQDYYQQTLETFAVELMLVPIDRFVLGMAAIEDPDEVAEAVAKAGDILACTFNKSQQDVQNDLNKFVSGLPVNDYREAKILRSRGMLN